LPKLTLAYIIGTYPQLTTTFIDREIKALQRNGVDLRVLSIRRPSIRLSDDQKRLQRDVRYMFPIPWKELIRAHIWYGLRRKPLTYFATLFFLLSRAHPNIRARGKTLLHFVEGVYAAYLLRDTSCDHIHAHFIDRAAVVALIVSRLHGIPYSVTAHANDIYTNPILIHEKLSEAKFISTCTAYNKAYLSRTGKNGTDAKLHCIHHGLDFHEYQVDISKSEGDPLICAIGQLKEKKGFSYLIKACRILKDKGYEFRCQIIGAGPLQSALESLLRELSLEDRVVLRGMLPHEQVIEEYKKSTIFVLPCITGSDGDRDGIPNVILEAMAMKLPVVSTDHSGIPEVVVNGQNGLLVPPADEIALSEALAILLDDPDLRQRFGERGREMVTKNFDIHQNVKLLLSHFYSQ
jgi:colanic acid/amylovoran biosynthesis glycosyltransferase